MPEPGDPQSLNRFSYVENNPLKYIDPTGHFPDALLDFAFIAYDLTEIYHEGWTTENTLAFAADVAALFIPVATGGGPAVRLALAGGGSLVAHLPAELRVAQATIKVLQESNNGGNGQLELPGFDDVPKKTYVPDKLDKTAKDKLRAQARTRFYNAHRDLQGLGLEVHHKIPLEWAHLFPTDDPNRLTNLVGLNDRVHDLIDARWAAFRSEHARIGREPLAWEVERYANQINLEFSQFYNQAP